jgi:hypothetical protein
VSYSELCEMPSETRPAILECAGNSRVFLVPRALAGLRVGHLLAGRPRAVLGLVVFVTLLPVVALTTTLVR